MYVRNSNPVQCSRLSLTMCLIVFFFVCLFVFLFSFFSKFAFFFPIHASLSEGGNTLALFAIDWQAFT